LALEVGFGRGRFLLGLARQNPQWNVLGIEIRQHLVDGVIAAAREEGLCNAHALLANANLHLDQLVPARSVAFVAVNFPDPWYKKRHQKRRVVCLAWLTVLSQKLMEGAELHAMSDYEPIAIEMRDLLEEQTGLANLEGRGQFAPRSTTGISSEREEKHMARGDPIFRLRFRFDGGSGFAAAAQSIGAAAESLGRFCPDNLVDSTPSWYYNG
jgi:tRNA (guanine-N7-)-methyltransferase